jgi:hypothetical protein
VTEFFKFSTLVVRSAIVTTFLIAGLARPLAALIRQLVYGGLTSKSFGFRIKLQLNREGL